jgi:hypothetical protein
MSETLQTNLEWSREAVRYVEAALPIGADNVGEDNPLFAQAEECVPNLSYRASGEKGLSVGQIADIALKSGCGCCGEQSAVAFQWLLQRGVRPLDWVERGLINHAFVVIGRKADSFIKDHTSWGEDAVVCDPWMYDQYGMDVSAYPACEIATKWQDKYAVRIMKDGRATWYEANEDGLIWKSIFFKSHKRID